MSSDLVEIDDVSIPQDEATETLRAIRRGQVDALVVKAPNGHAVVTFRDPDHAYRALVEKMGEGAALVTLDGVVSYHNPRFAELLADGAPLRGRALRDLVVPDAVGAIQAMLDRARLGPARIEIDFVSTKRRPQPVQLTASAATVADVPTLCVVASDLREHREQLRLHQTALAGMRARERLISVAGHELRAPLQAIVLEITRLLVGQRDGSAGVPTTIDTLESIRRQTMQLAHLVGNLLDVGVVGDRLELTLEDVDLAEVVGDAVRGCSDLTSGSALELELASVRGHWDRARLQQVATNLISNAAKYGLGRPIRIVVESDDRMARLVVEDHGVGLTPDEVARVFLPFERIGSVKSAPGFGLGLYIVEQIVKAHDGTIRLESEPGVATVFAVELPRR